MLGDITAAGELYIVTGYTDMRKSIDGLCAIVEDQLHMDPRRSALYLFCGKRCDRVKALLWENDGFVFLYKRMEVKAGSAGHVQVRKCVSLHGSNSIGLCQVLKSNSLKHLKRREALKILAFLLLF
mgnify:CR=1 FL=1